MALSGHALALLRRLLLGVRRTSPTQASARAAYEYTPFCNGPVDVKRPLDRHVAELMLLSVVDAKAAT